jgi:hypothetical protein
MVEASLSMQVANLKYCHNFHVPISSRDCDLSELIRPLGGGSNSKLELLILLLLTAYGKESVTANVQSRKIICNALSHQILFHFGGVLFF